MTAPDLTSPQVDALRMLADGESHPTWKQRTRGTHVNFLAARSLRDLGLARLIMSWGSSRVVITEAGRAAVDAPHFGVCCEMCGRAITADEWDERHTGEDGEDIHAACCEKSGVCSTSGT